MPTQVYTTSSGFGVTMYLAYSPLKSLYAGEINERTSTLPLSSSNALS
ncbi:MAG TPA: hypothetical protein ACHBY4_15395 [Arsenophonus apicola]